MKRAEYERDELQAMLQQAEREQNRYADTIHHVQSSVDDLEKFEAEASSTFQ